MVPPWRKLNSNHRLPLRPKQQPYLPEPQRLAIWLQTEKHDGSCRLKQKAVEEKSPRETPLCCTRGRQQSKDLQAKWMFLFCVAFLTYDLFVGRLGFLLNRTCSQSLKANIRLNNGKSDCKIRTGLRVQWDACWVSSCRLLWWRVL